MDEPEKIDLRSKDILAERLDKLRDLLPEAFREGKIDFDALKQALGEEIDPGRERYGLTWAGKSEAIKNIQTPSVGTLVPVPEESVNFDTTENLIIEGDNLEVLKLLQKSYHGKVKMIYIDPPYNTGNEFIYPDNFREGLEDYLRYSGQKNGDGIKLTTNTETDGRYHSKWLNMMYPRLFLARNLLREDGVIFVSIDDHEFNNLLCIMKEIFGEENYVTSLVWQSKKGGGSDTSTIVVDHEYIICFARSLINSPFAKKQLNSEPLDKIDEKGPYRIGRELNKWGSGSSREDRPTMWFAIPGPNGEEVYPIRNDGSEGRWRWGKTKMMDIVNRGDVEFVKRSDGTYIAYEKIRSTNPRLKPYRSWLTDVGATADGSKTVRDLFEGQKTVDFPKPVSLLRTLIEMIEFEDKDIIMDFFAGSGTTAQAVLEMNNNDEGNRKFILVQLPEPTGNPDYPSIADITKERVRRVIGKLNNEETKELDFGEGKQDRGFMVFKLTSSNFKIWDAAEAPRDADELAKQLTLFADNLKPDRSQLDILYEILIKAGLPLTAPVEEITTAGQKVFSVAGGQLLICLEQPIQRETLRGMMKLQPRQVICLDAAFHGQDKLKTNTVLEMKSHDIQFRTV